MADIIPLGRRRRARPPSRGAPKRRRGRLARLPALPTLLVALGLAGLTALEAPVWVDRGLSATGLDLTGLDLTGLDLPTLDITGFPLPGLPGAPSAGRGEGRPLPLCNGAARRDCVIDGDTFRLGPEKIRIADIDTPELNGACPRERQLAVQARDRLQVLLGEGPFELKRGARDTDRYGRSLRTVTRDGRSLGAVLVAEGLAREWTGRRRGWCG
ncbi:thermonuclease family protein [Lutibaculum baratangense]|uniref:Nuclease n=1 Tax=Lutibaculum baratangense AMV1 TaxID=631454 RepID=V4R958_9HYPH|nr:thermonuclease family protein [Lutibaculum baratangense]ESR22731.1 nuclease [Lutibaculum baratangense AMV1]